MFWFRHSCVTNRPCIFLRYSVSVTYTPPFMCALKDKIKDGDTIIQGQITQADYTIYFKKKKKKRAAHCFWDYSPHELFTCMKSKICPSHFWTKQKPESFQYQTCQFHTKLFLMNCRIFVNSVIYPAGASHHTAAFRYFSDLLAEVTRSHIHKLLWMWLHSNLGVSLHDLKV